MLDLQKLKVRVLADGAIDEDDVDFICEALLRERRMDKKVVQFLDSLRKEARKICPLFQQFFLDAVEFIVLLDGRIDTKEVAWLSQMLFADGKINEHEMRFLWYLKRRAKWICPEFQALYDEYM